MPPGRLSLYTPVVFLDCRCILQGFTWLAAASGLVDLERLVDSFRDDVPVGYCVNVKGADTELHLNRPYLRVSYGTLLSVSFVADAGDSEMSSSDSSQGDSSGDAPAADDPPATDDTPPVGGPLTMPRDRSRSPPPRTSTTTVENLKPAAQLDSQRPCYIGLLGSSFVEIGSGWSKYVSRAHLHSSAWRLFSSLLSCVTDWRTSCVCPLSFDCGLVQHKCLDEPRPVSSSQQTAIAFLRYAAPRLGQAWRYVPPRDAPYIIPDSESETDEVSDGEPATLHFAVLSPGFIPAHVTLSCNCRRP